MSRYLIQTRWLTVARHHHRRPVQVDICHAYPDGGPVLYLESSWRTVNGVRVVAGHWRAFLLFRRWG